MMTDEIRTFLDKEGRLKHWPSRRHHKDAVLRWLGLCFAPGRFYTEREVNAILEQAHSFGDFFLLRREMVEAGVLQRTRNGSKYWRGRLWPHWQPFETERLSIKAAGSDDFPALWTVYDACRHDALWEGLDEPCSEDSLRDELEGRRLPPNGSSEFARMTLLTHRESGQPAGLAATYTGYPRESACWLGLFLLHPDFRRQGLGREFVAAYHAECALQGYDRVGLGVSLRNQSGMKFWVEMGYRQISSMTMDGEKEPGRPGMLGLWQTLENPLPVKPPMPAEEEATAALDGSR